MITIPDEGPINFGLDAVPEDKVSGIAGLVKALKSAEEKVANIQIALEEATAAMNEIACNQLPAAMQELGWRDITLLDGTKLEIKTEYHPGLSEKNRAAVFAWLRANNCDSIIKRYLAVRFGKGEDQAAETLKAALKKLLPDDMPIEDKSDIHSSTLKAFVRERMTREADQRAEGVEPPNPFPAETFGVFVINRAVLK